MRKGYKLFLLGTATDLPCKPFKPVQRRDAVEAAAGFSGVVTGRRRVSGVRAKTWNKGPHSKIS